MNKNKINLKNVKKPYVYELFNKRVTELIGSKIKLKLKKFNFNFKSWIWFNISITVSCHKVILSKLVSNLEF